MMKKWSSRGLGIYLDGERVADCDNANRAASMAVSLAAREALYKALSDAEDWLNKGWNDQDQKNINVAGAANVIRSALAKVGR